MFINALEIELSFSAHSNLAMTENPVNLNKYLEGCIEVLPFEHYIRSFTRPFFF